MKKLIWLSLGLLLLPLGAGLSLAQEDANGATPPPKVLVVMREMVKPGRDGSMHEKTESAFVRAMTAAKWPTHYIGMTSLSGEPRALFFVGYDSFADWEKDNTAMEHNAVLSAELDRDGIADGDLLTSEAQSVWTYSDEYSLNSAVRIGEMRYMEISIFKVRPGHRKDWNELVKLYKDGYAKVPDAHWATWEAQYNGDSDDEYLVVNPMKSMSEIDQGMVDSKDFEGSLGPDGMKRLSELSAACIDSVRTNLFHFNPKMSYVPEEWIKADPGFWKVKTEAPMKKEPAKPAPAQ